MFFLGISAHLFIYLLVPAFLLVCFYFRGTSGNPEAVTLLPEAIFYEQQTHRYSKEDYIYRIEQQQEKIEEEKVLVPAPTDVPDFPYYLADYSSLSHTTPGLRAPPASL